ncbi:MAG: RsmE family RNA methyltransferase, partial [Vitreoscilla sp.]|nr:RsmE family RNA methyltransferase [Polaromonas sp.]
ACEQCGRNRVPLIQAPASLTDWLKTQNAAGDVRLLLSLQTGSQPLLKAVDTNRAMTFLSGPEGGLSALEEVAAVAKGFAPVTLGPRVLRSETAPLACLSLVLLTGNA